MEWRDIPTLERRYQVSDTGIVRSHPNRLSNGIVVKQQTVGGYKVFGYYYLRHNKHKMMKVHRAVAMAFISNPLNLSQVNHKDGNKLNNFLGNLEWSTASNNLRHSFSIGIKSCKGEKHSQSILTDSLVIMIREEYNGDAKSLALKYKVARSTISNIVTGRRWKHLLPQ